MDNLRKLLDGTYRDPDTEEVLHVPMKSLVIEPTLAGCECDLVKALDLPTMKEYLKTLEPRQ